MKKLIKKGLVLIFLFFTLVCGLVAFLVFTTPGFKTLVRLSSIYLHQSITAKGVKGSLFDQPQISELNYKYKNLAFNLKNVELDWDLTSLMQRSVPIKQLHAKSLHIKQKNTLINLNNIRISALLTNKDFNLNSLSFNYLNIHVLAQSKTNTVYPYASQSTIKLSSADKVKGLDGALHIGGDINLINWSGDFQGLANLSLQGSLKHLKQLEQTIKWRHLNWFSDNTLKTLSKEGRISAFGTLPNLTIQIATRVNPTQHDEWQINAELQGNTSWNWNFNVNALQSGLSTQPGIHTNFNLKGALQSPNQGMLTIKVAPGYYQMPDTPELSALAFQGGTVDIKLSNKGVTGLGTLSLDEHKKVTLQFDLPKFNLQQGLSPKQKVSSELSLIVDSFDFLSTLTPEIKNPKGTLMVSLFAKGPLNKPTIETKLNLNKASLELPNLGINLNAINYSLTGIKDRWESIGAISSSNKILNIKGQGSLKAPWPLEFTLEGADIPVINTAEYQINATPKLQVKYNQNTWFVTGSIIVPRAQIKIQSFSNSISLSNDVVFKSKEKNYSSPLRTQMNVKVEAGQEVELNAKGLHATLAGTVNINQLPQSTINATGELNVVEGEYKAYGQNLSIEQGELFFTGGAITNPGINIRASKTIKTSSIDSNNSNQLLDFNNNNLQNGNLRGDISVGVEVTGRLTEPDIQLFSTPALLSQADILSMLVLGRPASQANKAGGQLLLTAISSMNLGSGTKGGQMLEQLKQSLGVDFNVETNSNYNLLTNTVSDKTAFVVSKSLSKRISLGYNVGLSQADPNVLTLKYLLNKFFSIQINTSNTSSGIDVLYTSSKK